MSRFNDKTWSVSVGKNSWAAWDYPTWCKKNNIKYDYDWTVEPTTRITMLNIYFNSEEDYILFKLTWL